MDDHLLSAYRRGLGALVPQGFRAFTGSLSPTVSVREDEGEGERRRQERLRKRTTVECNRNVAINKSEVKNQENEEDLCIYDELHDHIADGTNNEKGVMDVESDLKEGDIEGKSKEEEEEKEEIEQDEIDKERKRNEDEDKEEERETEEETIGERLHYKSSRAINHKWRKIPQKWEVILHMKLDIFHDLINEVKEDEIKYNKIMLNKINFYQIE